MLNSLLTDKSSSRARLNKTEADNLLITNNSNSSPSRARLSKTNTKYKSLRDTIFLEVLSVPKPINEDLPYADAPDVRLDTRLSLKKQKEYDDENDRVVKRLKALLA